MTFTPFEDHGESTTIDGLTIENGEDRVEIYGRIEIRKDRPGLEVAQTLKRQIDAIVHALEGAAHLPEKLPCGESGHAVDNPFD